MWRPADIPSVWRGAATTLIRHLELIFGPLAVDAESAADGWQGNLE